MRDMKQFNSQTGSLDFSAVEYHSPSHGWILLVEDHRPGAHTEDPLYINIDGINKHDAFIVACNTLRALSETLG